jgi:hypothetical protein
MTAVARPLFHYTTHNTQYLLRLPSWSSFLSFYDTYILQHARIMMRGQEWNKFLLGLALLLLWRTTYHGIASSYLNGARPMSSEQLRFSQGIAPVYDTAEAQQGSVRHGVSSRILSQDHVISKQTLATSIARQLLDTAQNEARKAPMDLRFDWGHLEVLSPLGQQFLAHQSNCSLPLADFRYRNRFGLGSDLHLWSQALCNGMESHVRVVTRKEWIYWDRTACDNNNNSAHDGSSSAMTCYFSRAEQLCPNDEHGFPDEPRPKLYSGRGSIGNSCPNVTALYDISTIRAATMEVLFTGASEIVLREARQQMSKVFYGRTTVPSDLVTVHIRWGDKKKEMELVQVDQYVLAVQRLRPNQTNVHVFLATEDPFAVHSFRKAAPESWTIYVDAYFDEFKDQRNPNYNGNPKMSKDLHGSPGLVAIASLLVALEANDFVLTTASNWSRLLNELRQTIVHPRVPQGTRMIDLRPGEW